MPIPNLYKQLGLLLASLLTLSACQTMGEPDRATMAMGFAEAAYGLGVEPDGRHAVVNRSRLARWNRDKGVILSIKGEPADSPLYQRIERELQDLYRLASLNLARGLTSTDQLLIVTVDDDPLLVTSEIKTRCYTHLENVHDGHLKLVRIVMSRGMLDAGASDCLLHEGMHSLGFNGHPHRLDSLLSYTQAQNALTEIDRQLIDMLYHRQLDDAIPLDEAVSFAYVHFPGFRQQRSKRYTPLDISLEIKQDESPLVLAPPFMEDASRQFYYKTTRVGNRTTKASYGLRDAGQSFAELTYSDLASGYLFIEQPGIVEYAEVYSAYIGSATQREQGQVAHDRGPFDYVILDSASYSCVVTIKHINAGRNSRFHGGYCRDIENPMEQEDAAEFVDAIRVFDRDPVRLREQRMLRRKAVGGDILSISLIGLWPLDGSYISGLKLVAGGQTEGKMLIEINDEICEGSLTNIDSSGLGKWSLDCEQTEDARGRFSWDQDGTLSFRGETSQSGQAIDWTAHPVF